VDKVEAEQEYGVNPIDKPVPNVYDGIVLAVAHKEFYSMAAEVHRWGKPVHVLYDLKYVFPKEAVDIRL
jgi:hypothetical protein